jgi:1,4-dihydroxy-2-naphthoyl-CoA hydrolase
MPTPRARNPAITPAASARALEDFFPGDLGIEVIEIDDDRAVGRLVCDRRHLHPGGYMHGGVWVAFADTVAAWGTMRNLAPEQSFTTIELKCNVVASAAVGDELLATGEPLHRGSRTQVWEVRIEKAGRLAANFVCTQMVLNPA